MVKVTHDSAELLIKRLMGSGIIVAMKDEQNKTVTLRLPESLVAQMDKIVSETNGWSRNLVATFLLETGIEAVEHECEQIRDEQEEPFRVYAEVKR